MSFDSVPECVINSQKYLPPTGDRNNDALK